MLISDIIYIGGIMRLKHIKGADKEVNESKYYINNPGEYIGRYKDIFSNDNPIHIEIGMGKGDFIIGMALKYPNINFIGIEKYTSVLVKATRKLEELDINNLRLIHYDAIDIDKIFAKEISRIYLNFSDPWPKTRHEKRRLTSYNFLNKYDKIFINNKNIVMKTDNRKLFEYSIMSFNNYGYKISDISLDLYSDDIKDNVATEYEKKFVSNGNIIYKIEVNN